MFGLVKKILGIYDGNKERQKEIIEGMEIDEVLSGNNELNALAEENRDLLDSGLVELAEKAIFTEDEEIAEELNKEVKKRWSLFSKRRK